MRYDVVGSFGCDAAQVALARNWVHDELAGRLPEQVGPDLVHDAALIVSELLTNAIRAGCADVTVGLALEPDCLRLCVTDDAPGLPAIRDIRPTEHSGRGLPIVATLAHDWGVVTPRSPRERRKEVWATLAMQ